MFQQSDTIPLSPLSRSDTDTLLHLLAPSLLIDLDPGTGCDALVSLNEERLVLLPTLDHSQGLGRAIQGWGEMEGNEIVAKVFI